MCTCTRTKFIGIFYDRCILLNVLYGYVLYGTETNIIINVKLDKYRLAYIGILDGGKLGWGLREQLIQNIWN